MRQRQLYRQQFSVSILSSSSLLLGSNPRRLGMILSSPPSPIDSGSPSSTIASAVSTAAVGVKASFTVPAGQSGVLQSATAFLIGGTAPTVALQIVRAGVTISLLSGLAPQSYSAPIQLIAGDTVQWNVTAGGAGSTCDFSLSVLTTPVTGRVTLSFIGAAVLDQGITLNPGTAPLLILFDHIGNAIREQITAIASSSGTQISGLEIYEIDCPCDPATALMG